MNPKKIAAFAAVIILALLVAGALSWTKERYTFNEGTVSRKVEVEPVLPATVEVARGEGRKIVEGEVDLPIDREDRSFTLSDAILTLKGGYDIALPLASAWAKDARLVLVRSIGPVTAKGTAAEWQVLFASKEKEKGYEVLVFRDRAIRELEIESESSGYELPSDWYDSSDALSSLQGQPQFSKATLSSIQFFYNEDGKRWSYGLSTSEGTVSIPVR
ncbi:MAG: hypothetical protein HZA81_02180 [Candidatus Taylorbacteria bacterium]|nr:hypothetical protein [Candidatus Taylorbacteria bacterium]